MQWRMASRTAVSALPWHQYSAALVALDVDRRAGVAATDLDRGTENARAGTRSALALRHSGTRKRRYLSSSLRVASSGCLAPPPPAGRREEPITEAGVLRAVWNAGDEPADALAMPVGSQVGRKPPSSEKKSPAVARSVEHDPAHGDGLKSRAPSSSVVHRIENSSSGSMSMKDAVELLNDSPRPTPLTSRRSKDDGAHRALHLGHPPREKLSLRDGEASVSMAERASKGKLWFVRVCESSRGETRREASCDCE